MSEISLDPRFSPVRIDHTIISWRVWYTDDRVFDSETTTWDKLPADGLLLVRLYLGTKGCSREMGGCSLYWRQETDKGVIYAYDNAENAIIPQECWDNNLVKRGVWTTDQEMADVREAAMAAIEAPNEEIRTVAGA